MDLNLNNRQNILFNQVNIDSFSCVQINKIVNSLKISFTSVIKGTVYNDLCISEIQFDFKKNNNSDELLNADRDIIAPGNNEWFYTVYNCSISTRRNDNFVDKIADTILSGNILSSRLLNIEQPFSGFQMYQLILQSEYDRDYYIQVINRNSELLFKQESMSDAGGIDYTMRFETDAIIFSGECSYPECRKFKKTVKYKLINNHFLEI